MLGYCLLDFTKQLECCLQDGNYKTSQDNLLWCNSCLLMFLTSILALNTTPAIVVPVFRGLGACPLSKRPSNAAFLERGVRRGNRRGVKWLIYIHSWNNREHKIIVSFNWLHKINKQEKVTFTFESDVSSASLRFISFSYHRWNSLLLRKYKKEPHTSLRCRN